MLVEVSLIYFYIYIVVFIPLMTIVGEIEAAIKMQGEYVSVCFIYFFSV